MKLAQLLLMTLAAGCSPPSDSSAQASGEPPAAAASATSPPGAPQLAFPVDCRIGETCELQNLVDRDPGPDAKDYRCGLHTYEAHNGVDIRLLDMAAQRAGVDVLAAAPGRVARLRDGVSDISVKAPGAPSVEGQECGNGVVIDHGDGWETQYCHLARGSLRVAPGDTVATRQPIAQVGLSGNTEYPHLHMTVRRAGTIVDPFAPSAAPGACDASQASTGLWTPEAARALAYRRGVVLNTGFAAGPAPPEAVEAGKITPPTRQSPLVAYVRAINLEGGDVQALVLRSPQGEALAENTIPPLDRAKAQYGMYVGKRAPAGGWPPGAYVATYTVRREGAAVITETFEFRL